jgi:hypothetical protein
LLLAVIELSQNRLQQDSVAPHDGQVEQARDILCGGKSFSHQAGEANGALQIELDRADLGWGRTGDGVSNLLDRSCSCGARSGNHVASAGLLA